MHYQTTTLICPLRISQIVSVHYFEYAVDFSFAGEAHDFWELVYADRSELILSSDAMALRLPQGSLFLHRPMEFHNVRSDGKCAPNSVIVAFCCDCEALYALSGRVLHCNAEQKELLGRLIAEAKQAFQPPFDDPYTDRLERLDKPKFGSEQALGCYLELLLLSFVRMQKSYAKSADQDFLKKENRLQEILSFLADQVEENLTLRNICARFSMSESALQKLFRQQVGQGVMQYYRMLKIERAKALIREKRLNFSEIAERLGYSSIHYFSRHFKNSTGMTPSEYAGSVKARSHIEQN